MFEFAMPPRGFQIGRYLFTGTSGRPAEVMVIPHGGGILAVLLLDRMSRRHVRQLRAVENLRHAVEGEIAERLRVGPPAEGLLHWGWLAETDRDARRAILTALRGQLGLSQASVR